MNGRTDNDTSSLPPLPEYLEKCLAQLPEEHGIDLDSPCGPSLQSIRALRSRGHQYTALLLARHRLTEQLGESPGPVPELILQRAAIYEALGYSELALADAYVAYTLCEVVLEGPDISDLEPLEANGDPWPVSEDPTVALELKYRSLILLCRSALILGCQHQAKLWIDDLLEVKKKLLETTATEESPSMTPSEAAVDEFCDLFTVYAADLSLNTSVSELRKTPKFSLFGSSLRQVYPWNDHEPDRMSRHALDEINNKLREAAPDLEVEITVLPSLTTPRTGGKQGTSTSSSPEGSSQLGLYAKKDLAPGATILQERSAVTAIRPHGEALCDACAADMETIPQGERWYCPGCNLPFCSEACWDLARTKYHAPNEDDEETDEGYPPGQTPFCPGTSGNEDIHVLGRAESSTTPEWDLYFLLLSRTMQMAETQRVHPLDLFEIKYLWGDWSSRAPNNLKIPLKSGPKTLPYSVRHHVELVLQWFEILMHSRPRCRPYSKQWLVKYDWWIIQTLFAKFRGVADAQQSTWTGKPEVAAVHPLWCLANHSCNPNVTWKPSGVRNLTVVRERVWQPQQVSSSLANGHGSVNGSNGNANANGVSVPWTGIKAGEEIWNHYTDIHETDVRQRRARLRAVLGGDCRCERCTAEEKLITTTSIRGG
ncbi:hypothetical protein HRR83_003613 [Exophiala dermatitidis]|uniref:SET domain-containing protein n=2 Tax=Exophiala dermatitidis TaxID=5970 RepID=H6BSQ4_EXODN|nr:uncharacterized protein HMPREF1120_01600 [Exophiala dermatitidis NIH/UT8656]KAJ4519076.1 hypothetical protein HRR75_002754 [Exophiala dermatitidis]EHY53406.1 hypothetical protein HMPREF1120_01600 [Exophiala dermatitidis NIH/UT8656]KAJ4522422.1 hypothetical protein HRR74_003007 [Exophiala dermatitidis]KAJ4529747.1 hypothetical protein HRR73_000775 [Exophiala dermatitidis]KAJ4543086.1 hypothetical protein HRR77_005346 [Exophiala dermatitidis]